MAISPDELVQVLIEERVKLMAYIRSIVPDYHIAEDVFQEISILAVRKADEINDQSHLMAWLRLSARHRSINASKKNNRRGLPLDEELATKLDDAWSAYDEKHLSEEGEALERCIGQLTANAKRLVHLRYSEGMTGEQLAKQLNRPTTSTYVMLSRVHATLRKCIQDRLGISPRGRRTNA
ncbi:MAG: sigma-70 family RNA polymerase sigma factor [Phycisphaeraceae bacterium]|nr:sigma-70 family RNA polymerase sigma factor [Phycisphaeraceae bacterium]